MSVLVRHDGRSDSYPRADAPLERSAPPLGRSLLRAVPWALLIWAVVGLLIWAAYR